ncbi:MAG: T9SS type A sorting domain-containing protein, partial [Bacteroidota bacterium]
GFALEQNYPNPFNPTTTIEFTLPADGHVVLKVYDLAGREVATLVDGDRIAGVYQQVVFDASRLASGMYIARLQMNGMQLLRKMVLVK